MYVIILVLPVPVFRQQTRDGGGQTYHMFVLGEGVGAK